MMVKKKKKKKTSTPYHDGPWYWRWKTQLSEGSSLEKAQASLGGRRKQKEEAPLAQVPV
jgi:hypothetical protein